MSSLSAHFCPLVRVGSAVPFTASQAEEGAVAMATAKMENLAKVSCPLLVGAAVVVVVFTFKIGPISLSSTFMSVLIQGCSRFPWSKTSLPLRGLY